MKLMKQFSWLIIPLLFATTACGTAQATPNPAATLQPLEIGSPTFISANATSTASTNQSTPEPASTETGTNPPPESLPAPITSPQPATSPHRHPGDPIKLDQIKMINGNFGWAISQADILITSDGAQTWREVTPPQSLPSGSQVQAQGTFLDQFNAWIIFSIDNQVPPDAVVWHTTDGGKTWIASAPLNHEAYGDQVWVEFSVLDSTFAWLMVRGVYLGAGTHYAAQFFRTDNGGLTWLPLIGDVGVDYTGFIFADPNNGILTWQTTGAYDPSPPAYALTSDGAVNWNVRELPPPSDAPDLFDTSPDCEPYQPRLLSDRSIRLLVGCFDEYDPPHVFSSYLYSSDDGGSTWTSTRLPDKVLGSEDTLFFFDNRNALLLGRDIYRTTDGGMNWSFVRSVNWDAQFSFIDPQTGWAIARANNEAALVKTSNDGISWIEIKPIIAP